MFSCYIRFEIRSFASLPTKYPMNILVSMAFSALYTQSFWFVTMLFLLNITCFSFDRNFWKRNYARLWYWKFFWFLKKFTCILSDILLNRRLFLNILYIPYWKKNYNSAVTASGWFGILEFHNRVTQKTSHFELLTRKCFTEILISSY